MRISTKFARPREEWTTGRIMILMLCSIVIWYSVAQFVRYGGAAGLFTGKTAIQTYFATFLFTIPLNRFLRRLVGLPAKEMLSVAAV